MNAKSAFALIEPLMQDPDIAEIMIDHSDCVYVEKQGQLVDLPSPFTSEAQLYELIAAIATPMGRVVDEAHPLVDLRLENGTRVNIVIPPVSLGGPSITIRKQPALPLTMDMLLGYGCLSPAMAEFLKICVQARVNILISGGTGSGKSTLLRILAENIPLDERLVVLQQTFEISLPHRRQVRLETRPPDIEGRGEVTLRDLVGNALRMRPDRIVMVEATGGEAFDLATAMAAGHDGTLVSVHASNPRDAIDGFEGMASMGNPSVPLLVIRERIAEAIDLVVHQELLRDGRRKIMSISEVTGMENGAIQLSDIFQYQRTGYEDGKITGYFSATGIMPRFLPLLQEAGFDSLPVDMFAPTFKHTTAQRKWQADEIAKLDCQLGDTVCVMSIALRAGYSLRQVFDQLAAQAPEPCAGLWQCLLTDLKNGFSFAESLENMVQAVPSANLAEIAATIKNQQQSGGNLAFQLDPVATAIWSRVESDRSMAEMVRTLAMVVGAKELPPHLTF